MELIDNKEQGWFQLETPVEVSLYVLEDILFRVADCENQTKEDLASKFCKRRKKFSKFLSLEDRRKAFTRKSLGIISE